MGGAGSKCVWLLDSGCPRTGTDQLQEGKSQILIGLLVLVLMGLANGACQYQCPRYTNFSICAAEASTSALTVEQAPPNFCCQCLCPQWKFQWLPASLGGCLISASESNLGSFQITASALGLRVCEILCAPFKSGTFASYSPPTLLYTSPAGLQSQIFCRLIFSVQDPLAGELRSHAPWGEPLQWWLSCLLWVAYPGI